MDNQTYTHLKDYNYYSELYDKFTIEKCQRWEKHKYTKDISKLENKEKEIEAKERCFYKAVIPIALYFIKADCASKKSETIQEWMKQDREKDEKVINAKEPQGVRCLGCSSPLENCISCDLMNNHKGKEEVLFMFECSECGKRRAYWEDRTEWEYKPTCIKCNFEVQTESKREKDIITHTYSCSYCGHVEINLVVNTDAEQIIVANYNGKRTPKLEYCSGSLEDQAKIIPSATVDELEDGIIEQVCNILEGGESAFERRKKKYQISAKSQI